MSPAGGSKFGKPCDRLTAPCSFASCVITVKIVVPTAGSLLSSGFIVALGPPRAGHPIEEPHGDRHYGEPEPLAPGAGLQALRKRENVGAPRHHDRYRDHDAHQRFAGDQAGGEQHAATVEALERVRVVPSDPRLALD